MRIQPGVILQRDIRLHGHLSVADGLDAFGDAIDPTESVAMLSFRGQLYELNAVGAVLWEQLVAGSSEAELLDHLRARYALTEDRAANDLQAFLGSMREIGILDPDASGAAT